MSSSSSSASSTPNAAVTKQQQQQQSAVVENGENYCQQAQQQHSAVGLPSQMSTGATGSLNLLVNSNSKPPAAHHHSHFDYSIVAQRLQPDEAAYDSATQYHSQSLQQVTNNVSLNSLIQQAANPAGLVYSNNAGSSSNATVTSSSTFYTTSNARSSLQPTLNASTNFGGSSSGLVELSSSSVSPSKANASSSSSSSYSSSDLNALATLKYGAKETSIPVYSASHHSNNQLGYNEHYLGLLSFYTLLV